MSTPRPAIRRSWLGGAVLVVLVVLAAWLLWPGSSSPDSTLSAASSNARTSGTTTSTTTGTTSGTTTDTTRSRATSRATSGRTPGSESTAGSVDPETGLRWVELSALPSQARQTVTLIDQGGPYPYSRDGIVFGNRERLLPNERSGWYHEYTVSTPGSSDRGARRIVTGGPSGATAPSGLTFFYSDDHYGSFRRIRTS